MKFFYYLIGFCFLLAIYGIYNAVTINFYRTTFSIDELYYSIKIFEFIITIWFIHNYLKETVYKGLGIGKALIETFKLPKEYLNKLLKH